MAVRHRLVRHPLAELDTQVTNKPVGYDITQRLASRRLMNEE